MDSFMNNSFLEQESDESTFDSITAKTKTPVTETKTPIAESQPVSDAVTFDLVEDGHVTHVHPSVLKDFKIGDKTGNRRRSNRKDDESFEKSIKERGILQPVVARPNPANPLELELLGGYGRRDKAIKLNLSRIPVLIRQVSDEEALLIHIDENDKRSGLTLVDEVEQVKEFSTRFGGDRKAIAERLGWTVKKVSERLALGNCEDAIIAALDEGKIKPQHAVILSTFDATVQVNTLEKCLKEKWDVDTLKAKADTVKKPLSQAKFDTSACAGCKHNTGDQIGLFELDQNGDECSNFKCFREKTVEALKPKLEEHFGKVILLSETSEQAVNEVDPSNVGQEQFSNGCTGCDNNVAILGDTVSNIATARANQCVDKVCFLKCTKAHKASDNEQAAKTPSIQSSAEPKTSPKTPAKKVSAALPTAVKEHNDKLMREVGGLHFAKSTIALKAYQLAAMCKATGKSLGEANYVDFNSQVLTAMNMPEAELDKKIHELALFGIAKANNQTGNEDIKLMQNLLKTQEGGREVAIAGWTATKENLSIYTKGVLNEICEKSGFKAYVNQSNPKAFHEVSKLKKDMMVDAILKVDFNWDGYAPEQYLNAIN